MRQNNAVLPVFTWETQTEDVLNRTLFFNVLLLIFRCLLRSNYARIFSATTYGVKLHGVRWFALDYPLI